MPDKFRESDYSAQAANRLRAEMKTALVADGLFDKEAEAMLETWQESYFQGRGQRVFYLVPKEWTDKHLPIQVSVNSKITRVMVGRIELVTPEQRRLLGVLGGLPVTSPPPAAYRQMGRFANALIANDVRTRPGSILQKWSNALGLGVLSREEN